MAERHPSFQQQQRLEEESLVELEERLPPLAWSRGIRLGVASCTSSICLRCGTSRTAWRRPCQRLSGGSSFHPGVSPILTVSKLWLSIAEVMYLKLGQVIDVVVNNDPEAVWLVMRRHVALRVCGGHFDLQRKIRDTVRSRRWRERKVDYNEAGGQSIQGYNQ